MRILLIEDHEPTAVSLRKLLELQIRGAEVRISTDLEQAIKVAHEWDADITILDPGLPGVSREQALARIADFPPPVIVVTGYPDAGELLKLAYKCGALGFFEKRSLNGNLIQSIHDNYLHYALYVRPRNDATRQ